MNYDNSAGGVVIDVILFLDLITDLFGTCQLKSQPNHSPTKPRHASPSRYSLNSRDVKHLLTIGSQYVNRMTYGSAKIIEADMEPWQLQECVDCAVYALHHFKDEEEVSEFMKKEFDLKYEPCWHVVVGQSFGAYLGHDIRKCAYFSIGCLFFIIFKSPDTEVPYIHDDEEEEGNEVAQGGDAENAAEDGKNANSDGDNAAEAPAPADPDVAE